MAIALTEETITKMRDEFFRKQKCDRCGGSLMVRTMSWFTAETICGDCSAKETAIKKKLREQGKDPDSFEGCGSVPTV